MSAAADGSSYGSGASQGAAQRSMVALDLASLPTPVLRALAQQIAQEEARRRQVAAADAPVHRARGILGLARACPQCKAAPAEPCIFEDAVPNNDPVAPFLDQPPVTDPAPTLTTVEEHNIEIDPRADGKKAILDSGDAVYLQGDGSHRIGRIVSMELTPTYSGQIRYRVAWPDSHGKDGWSHTYHGREQIIYCGVLYPGMLPTPEGPVPAPVVTRDRRPTIFYGDFPHHASA